MYEFSLNTSSGWRGVMNLHPHPRQRRLFGPGCKCKSKNMSCSYDNKHYSFLLWFWSTPQHPHNYATPNHDAPSSVLHNIIEHTIARGFPCHFQHHSQPSTPQCWLYIHLWMRLSSIAPPSNPYSQLSH